jgi:hypothetical protein
LTTKKQYEKYTSKDLFTYWVDTYKAKHNVKYSHREFGGTELSRFKDALEKYGIYALLLGIKKGIDSGERSVRFFCENIDKYIVETNYAKYIFLIKKFAPPELKDLLVELGVLETKWTQNVRTQKRLVEIVEKFDDWCEIKGY